MTIWLIIAAAGIAWAAFALGRDYGEWFAAGEPEFNRLQRFGRRPMLTWREWDNEVCSKANWDRWFSSNDQRDYKEWLAADIASRRTA